MALRSAFGGGVARERPVAEKLNALFIMVDQMKATSSHLWGCPWNPTPGLEALAALGTRFDQAHTPHPLCVPARVAFWTGRYPHNTGVRINAGGVPPESWHAFRAWKAAGYTTALIGKDHCFMDPAHQDAFDVWVEISHTGPQGRWRGMEPVRDRASVAADHAVRARMEDPSYTPERGEFVKAATFNYAVADRPLSTFSTATVTQQAKRFLEERGRDPFVMWLSYPDPHNPYEAPASYFDLVRPSVRYPAWRRDEFEDAPERNKVLWHLMDLSRETDEHVRGVIAAYHAMVRFVDDQIGELLGSLEERGLLEKTVVVFCSDHGDFAGEHMMMGKGGAFFDCLTRVPLIVALKGAPWAGAVEGRPVSLLDVVPTVLSMQGLKATACSDGRLLPTITDAEPRAFVCSEYGDGGPRITVADLTAGNIPRGRAGVRATLVAREAEGHRKMLRTERWKYVHDPCGDDDELYDLGRDPHELYNLAPYAEHRGTLEELHSMLVRWSLDVGVPEAERPRRRG